MLKHRELQTSPVSFMYGQIMYVFLVSVILFIKMNYTKLKINIQYVIKRSDPALVVYI